MLRANALGDLIFSLPAFDALRAAYPEAEISLLGREWHADFLRNRPGAIDRVIVVPDHPGVTVAPGEEVDPAAIAEFIDRMAREHFDLGIQLHGGGGHSNPFLSSLGATHTAGTRGKDATPLDRTISYVYFQNEVLRWLEVVSLVGARPVTIEPHLAVIDRDKEEAAGVVMPGDRPIAVVHPGVSSIDRAWPVEKFAAVGDVLATAGVRVVISGGPDERELTATMKALMTEPAEDIGGRLSLGGLAGLLSRAGLVVANDTGPLHLASAVGAPTVGVFWCFNAINGGHTAADNHRPVISWRIHCSQCGQSQLAVPPCDHAESYVKDIPVEQVTEPALELLAG